MSSAFFIRNIRLMSPRDEGRKAVFITPNRLEVLSREAPAPQHARVLDGENGFLVPGFIDLQINGGFGHDFTVRPESIWQVAELLPRFGVTAFLPTIITSPPETTARALQVLRNPPAGFHGARPLGLHLEGPFLNPQKKGAHNPAYLRLPEPQQDWSVENGVRMVTLAPELPGALELAQALSERGILVSAGHSMATYAEALRGVEAGIRCGTHLLNAMPPLHHREPGLAGHLLAHPATAAGLIADGEHLHPQMVRLVWHAMGPDRVHLVSDAMEALGMPPGEYQLGDFLVTVSNEKARLADGTLAGSVMPLDAALRNLVAFTGCRLSNALKTVTQNPAVLLDLSRAFGNIHTQDQAADLVLLSKDLHVQATFASGRLVFQRGKGNTSP